MSEFTVEQYEKARKVRLDWDIKRIREDAELEVQRRMWRDPAHREKLMREFNEVLKDFYKREAANEQGN